MYSPMLRGVALRPPCSTINGPPVPTARALICWAPAAEFCRLWPHWERPGAAARVKVKIQTRRTHALLGRFAPPTFLLQMRATLPCRYKFIVPELACHKWFFFGGILRGILWKWESVQPPAALTAQRLEVFLLLAGAAWGKTAADIAGGIENARVRASNSIDSASRTEVAPATGAHAQSKRARPRFRIWPAVVSAVMFCGGRSQLHGAGARGQKSVERTLPSARMSPLGLRKNNFLARAFSVEASRGRGVAGQCGNLRMHETKKPHAATLAGAISIF